jgi:hypothetical protein
MSGAATALRRRCRHVEEAARQLQDLLVRSLEAVLGQGIPAACARVVANCFGMRLHAKTSSNDLPRRYYGLFSYHYVKYTCHILGRYS